MRAIHAGLLTALAALLISSCEAIQFGDPNEISPEARIGHSTDLWDLGRTSD